MNLPIAKILWAPTNAAHYNHLHVEGAPTRGGDCTSQWTPAIRQIVDALNDRFGTGGHYQVWDDSFGWTHMGVYNCRDIAGTTIPSQHSFSNAIDIGPYYGVEQQQKFLDFLTGKEEDMPLSDSDIQRIWRFAVPDQDDGEGTRGTSHALKDAWGNTERILQIVQNLSTSGGTGLSEAQVRKVVQEELAKLTLKST